MSTKAGAKSTHACGVCGSSNVRKAFIDDVSQWLCQCGEHWKAKTDPYSQPPKYLAGKPVYKRSKNSKLGKY
jgi:hypothetical protein